MGSFELKVRRSAAMASSNGKAGGQAAPFMASPFASTASMDSAGPPVAPPAQQSVEESSDDEDESTIAVEANKVTWRKQLSGSTGEDNML